jgi:hypothetical protein
VPYAIRTFRTTRRGPVNIVCGSRPGVTPSSIGPLPQDWRTGTNTLVCFAVTKTRVTGSLRDH